MNDDLERAAIEEATRDILKNLGYQPNEWKYVHVVEKILRELVDEVLK